ncbi:hypothetical protein ACTFIR_011860 [Dictyostelium discoideum]
MKCYLCSHVNCGKIINGNSSSISIHQSEPHVCCTPGKRCFSRKRLFKTKCRHPSCNKFLVMNHLRRHEESSSHKNNKCRDQNCVPCYKPETLTRGRQAGTGRVPSISNILPRVQVIHSQSPVPPTLSLSPSSL